MGVRCDDKSHRVILVCLLGALGIPAGHRWYGITILEHGTVQFTEAQMRAGPRLTLN